jgi:hypothetical protein
MHLGKAIRLGCLFDDRSGRLLAITLDHAIARGVLGELRDGAQEPGDGQDGTESSTGETEGVSWSVGGLGKQT